MANKKILIVEDEVVLLEMMKIRLEKENFTVVTAENGKEGLLKTFSEKPDLLLVDIMLPEMDGIEMIKVLQGNTDYKDIPIIVVSALGRDVDIERARQAGAREYIIKPFTIDDLAKKIRKHLK